MPYTIEILINFFGMLMDAAPVVLGLISIISILAVVIAKREQWSISDSLYYGFITATTVGYGDFHPTHDRNKLIAGIFGVRVKTYDRPLLAASLLNCATSVANSMQLTLPVRGSSRYYAQYNYIFHRPD